MELGKLAPRLQGGEPKPECLDPYKKADQASQQNKKEELQKGRIKCLTFYEMFFCCCHSRACLMTQK